MNKVIVGIPLLVLAVGGAACATKTFVRTRVADVNARVDSLGQSVEETEERTVRNESKIAEVDAKAQNAAGAAAQASGAAARAQTAANAANGAAAAAGSKTDALDRASRRLVLELVLSESTCSFQFGKKDLPDAAKAQIDQMVSQLTQDPKNVYIEIEGHTDSVGPSPYNEKLGLQRAEAAERYLYEKHQIPLHKMNAISYGETRPVAPNTTKDGRAQNRRVVIRVLS